MFFEEQGAPNECERSILEVCERIRERSNAVIRKTDKHNKGM